MTLLPPLVLSDTTHIALRRYGAYASLLDLFDLMRFCVCDVLLLLTCR